MRTRPVLSLLPIVVLAATGCGDSPAANASSVPESERVAAPVAPAASHALAAAIEVARVRVEMVASTGEAEKARETLIAEQGSFHRGLDLLYEALGGKPYFAAEGALGEEVAPALLAFIDELDGHALDAAPYGKDALVAAHMAWQEAHERARTIRTRTADLRSREDRVRSAVRRWILAPPDLPGAAPGTTDSSPLATRLAAVGLSDEAIAHVEAVTVDAEQLAEAEAVEREALYKLDPLLVRALMQAVLDFRMVKRVHPKLALEHPERAPDYYAERLIALIAPETKPAPPEEKEEDAETGKKGKKKE